MNNRNAAFMIHTDKIRRQSSDEETTNEVRPTIVQEITTSLRWLFIILISLVVIYIIWSYVRIFQTGKWDIPFAVWLPTIRADKIKSRNAVLRITFILCFLVLILVGVENMYTHAILPSQESLVDQSIGCENWKSP